MLNKNIALFTFLSIELIWLALWVWKSIVGASEFWDGLIKVVTPFDVRILLYNFIGTIILFFITIVGAYYVDIFFNKKEMSFLQKLLISLLSLFIITQAIDLFAFSDLRSLSYFFYMLSAFFFMWG